jgi:hypothetical protein
VLVGKLNEKWSQGVQRSASQRAPQLPELECEEGVGQTDEDRDESENPHDDEAAG